MNFENYNTLEIEEMYDKHQELVENINLVLQEIDVIERLLSKINLDTYKILSAQLDELYQEKDQLIEQKRNLELEVKRVYVSLLETEKDFLSEWNRIQKLEPDAQLYDYYNSQHKRIEEVFLLLDKIYCKLTLDGSEEIKSLISKNVSSLRVPQSNGWWEGPCGKSKWRFESSYIPLKNNPEGLTCGEICERYNIDGIVYKNMEPDFAVVEDKDIGHVELLAFPISRQTTLGTYEMANIEVARRLTKNGSKVWTSKDVEQLMKKKGLTWHEDCDMKTVRAIPTLINSMFEHSGGISVKRGMRAIARTLEYRFNLSKGVSIQKQSLGVDDISAERVYHSIRLRKKEYNLQKKHLK